MGVLGVLLKHKDFVNLELAVRGHNCFLLDTKGVTHSSVRGNKTLMQTCKAGK